MNERKKSVELRELLGLDPVSLIIKNGRLRWLEHELLLIGLNVVQ